MQGQFPIYKQAVFGSVYTGDWEKRMRIIVLSSIAWADDNCFGSSFSNFFQGIDNLEIANISCRAGYPTGRQVKRYYQITEKTLISNLKNKENPSGREILCGSEHGCYEQQDDLKLRKIGQKKRWQILLWARDLIWAVGRWKSPELQKFIDDFAPDLIFQPIYFSGYLNDIAQYIKEHTMAPMIGYISDDCYTLKQFSVSPLYWIDRLYKRQKVKKTIEMCELLYVISDIQKEEYEKCFSTRCKILTKSADFYLEPELKKGYNHPLQLVYTGNIGTNRWKSLEMIADVLENINRDGIQVQLRIYTATPLTRRMEKVLNRGASSVVMGSVPASEVSEIQRNADMLVHVEALDLKNRLKVRQSFSTKIVDYLKMGRPILAVGPKNVASIDHLIRNDCAVAANRKTELERKLCSLLENPSELNRIAVNAYACGRKYHDKQDIQEMLLQDMKAVCGK